MHIHANIWHLIGRLNQTAADGFLPLRAFKPSYSDSADRGCSIIRVTFTALLLKSFSYRLIIEELPLHLILENFFYRLVIEELPLPPYYWRVSFTALLLESFLYPICELVTDVSKWLPYKIGVRVMMINATLENIYILHCLRWRHKSVST